MLTAMENCSVSFVDSSLNLGDSVNGNGIQLRSENPPEIIEFFEQVSEAKLKQNKSLKNVSLLDELVGNNFGEAANLLKVKQKL